MKNINSFKSFITRALIVLSILEITFFPNVITLVITLFILVGWWIAYKYVWTTYNLKFYPLSTFVLIGYTFFFIIMPMPATLIELKPIFYNLKNPIETFFHITLLFITLIITHHIYKFFFKKNPIRPIFKKIKLYNQISPSEIWVLSLASLLIIAINILIYGRFEDNSNKPFLLQIITYFALFVELPILFLFPSFGLIKTASRRKHYIPVVIFSLAVMLIGVASNFRTLVLSFISLGLASFLLAFLLNKIEIKIKPKYILIIFLAAWFFTGPFMDLSLSMIIVRGERTGISGMELLNKTLDVYSEKQTLKTYKSMLVRTSELLSKDDWDETYIDNAILSRFCSVKTIDETIYYAHKVGFADSRIRKEYWKQVIAIFPESVSSFLGMSPSERKDITVYSMTDYLYAEATNDFSILGGARIGSFPGIGLSIFGYAYLLVIIPIFLLLFIYFDSVVLVKNGEITFSVWAFLNLFLIFYITSAGHNFQTDIKIIIRGFFESIFFYSIAIYSVKKITRLLKLRK